MSDTQEDYIKKITSITDPNENPIINSMYNFSTTHFVSLNDNSHNEQTPLTRWALEMEKLRITFMFIKGDDDKNIYLFLSKEVDNINSLWGCHKIDYKIKEKVKEMYIRCVRLFGGTVFISCRVDLIINPLYKYDLESNLYLINKNQVDFLLS